MCLERNQLNKKHIGIDELTDQKRGAEAYDVQP